MVRHTSMRLTQAQADDLAACRQMLGCSQAGAIGKALRHLRGTLERDMRVFITLPPGGRGLTADAALRAAGNRD